MHIKVGGFVDLSLIDVLGHPSSVIFFSGCNFRCPWCHNKELWMKGKYVKISDIINRIKKNYLVDYVQASGGEPTLQPAGLENLFEEIKKLRLKTSLNTNGSNPDVIKKLIDKELVDHVAMDVKFPLDPDYPFEKIIGINDKSIVKRILRSLEILSDLDFVELRTTLVPELTEEDILRICEQIFSISENFIYVLQPCIIPSYTTQPSFLSNVAQKIKKTFPSSKIVLRNYYSTNLSFV